MFTLIPLKRLAMHLLAVMLLAVSAPTIFQSDRDVWGTVYIDGDLYDRGCSTY